VLQHQWFGCGGCFLRSVVGVVSVTSIGVPALVVALPSSAACGMLATCLYEACQSAAPAAAGLLHPRAWKLHRFS
jgi:hypothetical protein